jgi:transketolase
MSYESLLTELCQANENLMILTAENRAAIRGLPEKIGKRFIDCGIAEQTMVACAAGLALSGKRPFVHALAAFLSMRAFEFIRTDIGYACLPVILVGSLAGFLSDANGPTHQALEDVALMRGIPGMQVFCPADCEDLAGCVRASLLSEKPTYIRFYDGPVSVKHATSFAIGKAEKLSQGKEIALLTYGFLVKETALAAEILKKKGLSVSFINMRSLAPADGEAIYQAFVGHRLLVTIEDHFLTGGLASIVQETITERLFGARTSPGRVPGRTIKQKHQYAKLHHFALNARWFTPSLLDQVLEKEGFSAKKLASRIIALWKKCAND